MGQLRIASIDTEYMEYIYVLDVSISDICLACKLTCSYLQELTSRLELEKSLRAWTLGFFFLFSENTCNTQPLILVTWNGELENEDAPPPRG
jgi:hypothetical protein